MTVSTRLRSADRPATCGAARGTGIRVSSSTTDFDRGGRQGNALAGDGHDQQQLVHLPLPAPADLQRHQQPGAIVAVDALVLLARRFGLGPQPDRLLGRFAGDFSALRCDDEIGVAVMLVADDAIARGFDDRPKHVLHPRIIARQAANQLLGRARGGADVVREQPVRVDQLGRLAVDQRNAADLARPLGVDDVIVDRREVDDFGEGVADLVRAVVEAEQANLVLAKLGVGSSGKRKYGISDLHPKLTGRLLDRARSALPRSGRRPRGEARGGCRRAPRNSSTAVAFDAAAAGPSAIRAERSCASSLTPPTWASAGGVEQQDRAAVVGERGSGIKSGRHDRRSGGLHDQLLMVVDPVDRERIKVAAGRTKHDQRAVLLVDARSRCRGFRQAKLRARGGRGWSRRRRRRDARA